MNFGDEDELDFEEDLPENESSKNAEPENVAEGEKVDDPDLNGGDHYLQIDCLEDEEDLLSKVGVESDESGNNVNEKEPNTKDSVNETNDSSENQTVPSEKNPEDSHESSNFGKIKWKKGNERTFGIPLYRTQGLVRPNRWRPVNNFMRSARQNSGQRLNLLKGLPLRYPKLHHFSRSYLQNQNEFVSLLELSGSNNQNVQQANGLFAQSSNPMLEVKKNLAINGVLGQCNNAILNQIQGNHFSRLRGVLEQKLAADVNSKNFAVRSANGFKTNYNQGSLNEIQCSKEQARHVLPDEEKEVVASKKEARLIRFMNDHTSRKEIRLTENTSEVPVSGSLNLEEGYFRKMEEQKRKRQEIFNQKEKQWPDPWKESSASAEKVTINKELLLKKENPFENCTETTERNVKFEIKKEKGEANVRVSQNGVSLPEGLCCVKKEVEFPVKFIRTVSKTFEELSLSKSKLGLFSGVGTESDARPGKDSDSGSKTGLVDTASQTQMEPHLTGCIVKVLNVPPSATANDILALCTPIGVVREVKLNLPKENSAAIRFAEPKSAESFFNLYHGRVIDDHTLNVITV